MTEHEKLKWIMDQIGYDIKIEHTIHGISADQIEYDEELNWFKKWIYSHEIEVDLRTIIYTQDFMDKYRKYYLANICNSDILYDECMIVLLLSDLDNPTDYLYNLL